MQQYNAAALDKQRPEQTDWEGHGGLDWTMAVPFRRGGVL